MSQQKTGNNDETLLRTLEQLGKGLDILQELFSRIEACVSAPQADGVHSEHPRLTADVPIDRTIH